ncbi:MAG: cation:dicarboxylase symporter family transporter [Kiritimatiellae bacterium]|nr:cation:dicarboxylase symporter family transporter [Kiritimatiellia bacterium]
MKLKIGIVGRLFIAMAIGVALGYLKFDWMIRILNSFGGTFGQFIKFFVPFIIIGLVTPAIAETGKGAGRLLLATMCVAYASTLFAGGFAFATASLAFPKILDVTLVDAVKVTEFPAYFVLKIPPLMDVTTALVAAFVFGLAMVALDLPQLKHTFNEIRDAVSLTIKKALLPLLPIYILAVVTDLTASGKLAVVGGGCIKIMVLAFAVTTAVLVVQYAVAGVVAGRNPIKLIWNMLPAYLTGWGCCSSAATLPVTLRQTKKNEVSDKVTDLVIPLCANVHLAGSMANMVVYTAGFIVLAGGTLSLAQYIPFMLMLSVIAVASPGIPGGVVLASYGIASTALGFDEKSYALVTAAYMALDGMGTACNLTGDGAIAVVMNRFFGDKRQKTPES